MAAPLTDTKHLEMGIKDDSKDENSKDRGTLSNGAKLRASRYYHQVVKDEKEDIYYREPGSKKIVFFELKIKRISEIDTSGETFRCRFHIYLTWLATKEECENYDALKKKKEYVPDWTPQVRWANAVHHHNTTGEDATFYKIRGMESRGLKEMAWRIDEKYLNFVPWKGRWNRVKYEFDIVFADEMQLPGFPFDCQDLAMHMKVDDDGIHECDIVPFPRWTDFAMLDPSFSVLSEWDYENLFVEFGNTDSVKSKSKKKYALVSAHVKARRRFEAHIGQIIVTFCLFTLGLGTFAQGLEGEELGDRLGYCVTLLLADVAALQLLFDTLPNIPYWTIFDYYVYACFVFLFSVTIWSCIATINEDLIDFDDFMYYIALGLYLIAHVSFIVMSVRTSYNERKKLNMSSSQLDALYHQSKTARDRRPISVGWIEDDLYNDRQNDITKPRLILRKGSKNENENDKIAFASDPYSPRVEF